jgi:NADH-quinone oxidoreductase subunit N
MQSTSLIPVYPELLLAVMAFIVMTVDAFAPAARRTVHWLSLGTLAVLTALSADYAAGGSVAYTFNNMFVIDPVANVLKVCSYIAVAVTLIFARQYAADRGIMRGELYSLTLFALLGQMVMISANNLLLIYVGLELMSLSLYALVALRRDDNSAIEAAMKYFVLGALASGFMLYGMSMIYGATTTLDLSEIAKIVGTGQADKTILAFGLVFLVAGIAFKLGAAPFHMWVPDVYHGAPTAVTLLIGAAPKLASFAIMYRLLGEALLGAAADWQPMLLMVAVASIAIGNLTAIMQSNLKRMLAYSTISHMGFMLLGMLSGVVAGNARGAADAYSAAMFYTITYVLTTLGTFGVILLLARAGFEADSLDDLKGLNKRHPGYAFVMLILMFSLAGIPPAIGFYAKLVVLQALLAAGHVWLAVVAVLFSLIGAYYYLRVVKLMYFDEPVDTTPLQAQPGLRGVLALNGALVVGLGIVPGPLLSLCLMAMQRALGA